MSFLFSALLASISAFLKIEKHADFLFTSFIISAAINPYIDGLVSGPLRGKSGNLLATEFIPLKYRFMSFMPPSRFNISFVLALLLCVLLYFFMDRSFFGRRLCIYGVSNEFAKYAGIKEGIVTYFASFFSGGLHGLCGALTVMGTYFTCHAGFNAGMGWNALTVALIAKSNPLFIMPSGLLMGFITTYSKRFALIHNFGFDAGELFQSVILLIIAFPIYKWRKK